MVKPQNDPVQFFAIEVEGEAAFVPSPTQITLLHAGHWRMPGWTGWTNEDLYAEVTEKTPHHQTEGFHQAVRPPLLPFQFYDIVIKLLQ